jgi:hypothetical protein
VSQNQRIETAPTVTTKREVVTALVAGEGFGSGGTER